ncbi:MAG: AbrB/MazE/SpoVT family DNA-binding domain-containing protein [Candidatus Roizmanbacteria bacterium]
MKQKIIKVDNPLAITFPADFVKEAGYEAGNEVVVETSPQYGTVFIKPNSSKSITQ